MTENHDNDLLYASLAFRIKASIIDSVILLALIVLIPLWAGEHVSRPAVRVILMYSPLLVFEPFLVAYLGSTIGQRILGLTIVNQDSGKKCPLHLSFARYYTKVLLGWLSMVLMLFTRRHQAIHDHVAKTLVILSPSRILKDPSFALTGEHERQQDPDFTYPSVLRRFVFFIIWSFVAEIMLGLLLWGAITLISPRSLSDDGDLPKSVERALKYVDVIVLICTASLAAKGYLPGARKIPTVPEARQDA